MGKYFKILKNHLEFIFFASLKIIVKVEPRNFTFCHQVVPAISRRSLSLVVRKDVSHRKINCEHFLLLELKSKDLHRLRSLNCIASNT